MGGVPKALTSKLSAGEWVSAALKPLGGKCGPNPQLSQGQGAEIDKVDKAIETAIAYAQAQLEGWK